MTRHDGKTEKLTTKEAALLEYLVAREGRAVSSEELLREVWRYSKSVLSRTLPATVRRLRIKVELDPTSPKHILVATGFGYVFSPLKPEEKNARSSAVEIRREPRTNIDASRRLTRFFGRDEELKALVEHFDVGARLVTILGPGGVGKTRLAQEFARIEVEQSCPNGGIWFCELAEQRDLAGVERVIAGVLDVPPARLGAMLEGRGSMLLVLDNLEQVVDLACVPVARWLRIAPRLCILATSRERLGVEGEQVVVLDPLPEDDAAALFVDRASAMGLDLSEKDPIVHEIARRLDRLPLALELAAARGTMLDPRQILERLHARFRLLSHGQRNATPRQATLENAIHWSWELLAPWEKEAFAQCAVFAGGFSLEAAEAVIDVSHHLEAPPTMDVVQSLVEKSLVRRTETPGFKGEARCGLLESIRAFAAEKLHELSSADVARVRHRAYFVDTAAALSDGLVGPRATELVRRQAAELENFLVAFESARADKDSAAATTLVASIENLLASRMRLETSLEIVGAALTMAAGLDPEPRAALFTTRGLLSQRRGALIAARQDYTSAIELAVASGSPVLRRATRMLGTVCRELGDLDAAERTYRRSIELSRAAGDRADEASGLGNLARLYMETGRLEEAEPILRAAVATHVDTGDPRWELQERLTLAGLLLDLTRVDEAEDELRGVIRRAREVAYRSIEARAHGTLGRTLLLKGEPHRAKEALAEALSIAREHGYGLVEALTLSNLGLCAALGGDHRAAERHLRESCAVLEKSGNARALFYSKAYLALVYADQGSFEEAEAEVACLSEKLSGLGDPHAKAVLDIASAHLALAKGRAGNSGGPARGEHESTAREVVERWKNAASANVRIAMQVLERRM